jgi:hypothetical protein
VHIRESCWITLQASGSGVTHPIEDNFPQATTNPVWIMVGRQPVRSAASAEYFMRWIDKLERLAGDHPGWRTGGEKEHVLGQFRQARAIYQKRLDEARSRRSAISGR